MAVLGQSGQQRHPFAQGRGEIELAVHRPAGHGGDLRLEAGEVGELVDAFDGDDGAVHVAQQEPLAPAARAAARPGRRRPRRRSGASRRLGCGRIQRRSIAISAASASASQRASPPTAAAAAATSRAVERLPAGIGDQAGDGRHGHSRMAAGRGAIEALVVIGGSTASGKSALALALARQLGGVIVNADSQQLFADVPTLTARPPPPDEAAASRTGSTALLAADEQPSVGRWLTLVEPVSRDRAMPSGGRRSSSAAPASICTRSCTASRQCRIFRRHCAPSCAPGRRRAAAWRSRAARSGATLAWPARLQPGDRQRVLRALEVVEATGRSLVDLAGRPAPAAAFAGTAGRVRPGAAAGHRQPADRGQVRCDAGRAGALAEVADLLARRPDALLLPIAKVHGLRELAAVLGGTAALSGLGPRSPPRSGGYAKRQRTWFRHQLPELQPLGRPARPTGARRRSPPGWAPDSSQGARPVRSGPAHRPGWRESRSCHPAGPARRRPPARPPGRRRSPHPAPSRLRPAPPSGRAAGPGRRRRRPGDGGRCPPVGFAPESASRGLAPRPYRQARTPPTSALPA